MNQTMGRAIKGMLCLGTAMVATAGTAWAAEPANNDLVNAAPITAGQSLTGTLLDADPVPATGTDPQILDSGTLEAERNVWYAFAAPAAGSWTVDLCGASTNTDDGLAIEVWTPAVVSPPTPPAQRDSSPSTCPGAAPGESDRIQSFATAGPETVLIVVGDFQGGPGGANPNTTFSLRLRGGPDTASQLIYPPHGHPRLALSSKMTSAVDLTCAIDGAAPAACNSSRDVADLAGGPHTLTAVAKDAGGTPDPFPLDTTFTVDTTPPDTILGTVDTTDPSHPLIPLNATSTSGGAVFQCAVGGQPFASCNPGADQFSGLCTGVRTIRARAVDSAGNADPTPVQASVTTPAGTACGEPEGLVKMTAQAGATLNVDTNGQVVTAHVEYGLTTDYGFRTGDVQFSRDLTPSELAGATGAVQAVVITPPGTTTHARVVITDEDGHVHAGPDVARTLDPLPGPQPAVTMGEPIATPTSVDLPFTIEGGLTDAFTATTLVLLDPSAPSLSQITVDTLQLGPAAGVRSGTLRMAGLTPDTRYELLAIALVSSRSGAYVGPFAVRTPPIPAPPPPSSGGGGGAGGPGGGGNPAPGPAPKPKSPLGKLKLPKKLLLKLLKTGRLKPQLSCTAACSLRIRLLKGRTIVAQGTARRTKAGTATIALKPTLAGRRALKKVRRGKKLKLSLVAEAVSGKTTLGSIKRTITLR
jgi:hypothetical protein